MDSILDVCGNYSVNMPTQKEKRNSEPGNVPFLG
jgi:hypothetical protein